MNKKVIFLLMLALLTLFVIGSASAELFEFKDDVGGSVRIGYLPSDHDAALFVADAKGLFEDKGIETDLIKYNNGADLMEGMENGEIDVGYVGIAPAISSIEKGSGIKIISSAQNEGSGIIVKANSGILSAQDLQGKTVATPGKSSIQYLVLAYYLKDNGMSVKDVKLKEIKATKMGEALDSGEVDAVVSFQPYVSIIAADESNRIIGESFEILPNHPCCVVVASEDFIESNESAAEDIVDIHKQATNFINSNIKSGNTYEIVKLLPSEIVDDEDVEVISLQSFPFTSGLSSNFKSNVDTFQQLEVVMGLLDKKTSSEDIFWEA